jgi:hypothetical protein
MASSSRAGVYIMLGTALQLSETALLSQAEHNHMTRRFRRLGRILNKKEEDCESVEHFPSGSYCERLRLEMQLVSVSLER